MRPFQTVAQVLLIAFVANSALAVPGSAPEEILEKRRWSASDFANLLKGSVLQGILGGFIGAFGGAIQRIEVGQGTQNHTYAFLLLLSLTNPKRFNEPNHDKHLTYDHFHSRRSFDESLKGLTRTTQPWMSRALADLSDRDLRLLSTFSRRAIESLD
jgi:hypothetical protein